MADHEGSHAAEFQCATKWFPSDSTPSRTGGCSSTRSSRTPSMLPSEAATLWYSEFSDRTKVRPLRDTRRCEYQIATHLAALDSIDPRRIVTIRRTQVFGFDAGAILRKHFSQYGVVENVMLCRSRDEVAKPTVGYRQRPSRLCFLVMASVAEAASVLAAGEKQEVCGEMVSAHKFIPRGVAGHHERAASDVQLAREESHCLCSDIVCLPDCKFWSTSSNSHESIEKLVDS